MRMTEVQAGVGRIQLKFLKNNIKRRRYLARIFKKNYQVQIYFNFHQILKDIIMLITKYIFFKQKIIKKTIYKIISFL